MREPLEGAWVAGSAALRRGAHGVTLRGVLALDRAGTGKLGGAPRAAGEPVDADAAGALRCAVCSHAVTSARARCEVGGAHEHTFMNPAGLVFRIGCFSEAPGCTAIGPPSTEWSWFAGAAWRVALCASCRTHLGWSFEGEGAGRFWGLVLDRLLAAE